MIILRHKTDTANANTPGISIKKNNQDRKCVNVAIVT